MTILFSNFGFNVVGTALAFEVLLGAQHNCVLGIYDKTVLLESEYSVVRTFSDPTAGSIGFSINHTSTTKDHRKLIMVSRMLLRLTNIYRCYTLYLI